ncbi:MAG: glycosyl transferase [Clostridia bacterium]|nr:glycosyl transferase [Clostridia bacterium]
MNFIRENARQALGKAERKLADVFGELLTGSYSAAFTSVAEKNVIGAAGLPFTAPIHVAILNTPETACYVDSFGDVSHLFVYGDGVHHYTTDGEAVIPAEIEKALLAIYASVCESAGTLAENGDHIINLKADKIGTHFDANLLIGNRIGFKSPLLTTPKGAIDSLGRGSFRGTAARQVTATRYTLIPEQNGEPCNRQFYIVENGKQIFYSADVETNVKNAYCRHSHNYTEITYETECGLKITRDLFILPQEEGMPEAVEAQHVIVENLTDADRKLKIVFTGMFSLASTESLMNDTIYASVTWESSLLCKDGKPVAVAPNPWPGYLKVLKRFATVFADGDTLDEYTANYIDFIGNGTLEKPQHVAHLACTPVTKVVPFFAIAKSFTVPAGGKNTVDQLTGLVITPGGKDNMLDEQLDLLIEKYKDPKATVEALEKVKAFSAKYASFLKVKTRDRDFDAYVNNNLPFQVYYQSYVSRSFAWTQKAYREIGFREIQDMYASLYYIIGMGADGLAREMLGNWISNVHEMGYANHNFYHSGKEPGMCSDDGLWLVQAIFRYISLTGDVDFLNAEFPIAGTDGKMRTLWETLMAVVTYSGKISVGKHGLPLLDKADWNDCLKLDDNWINGPEKEKQYRAQLEADGTEYGVPFKSDFSESVMNAFLLKIAYDELSVIAALAGKADAKAEMDALSAALEERIQTHCWKGDFFARALVGGEREGGYTYLGAGKDGISADETIDGTYYLNSFSWSVLAGVATEEQIRTMLATMKQYLVTEAGIKLCTPADLGKLAQGTASSSYFPGDRENGGVFKHAAMMAASAFLKAAKTVSDETLAAELAETAFFAMDTVYPFKTMAHPYFTKGNPRFCTQYNNVTTGENIGPMLSGTASWLNLTLMEMLGIGYDGDDMVFSPVLEADMTDISYTVTNGDTVLNVNIKKPQGFARVNDKATFTFDGKPFDGRIKRPADGKTHEITIVLG